ncbi:hypothetical protein JXQ31_03660 [candidate division KSB1 bacterium]|nr:hypothetical protein [candidate division KSB1 bacterium]
MKSQKKEVAKIKEIFKSPHIHIALATGACIIILAYFSKRVLPRPIGYLANAIPPFLMAVYEALLSRFKDSKLCTTWYWIAAIFATTALIIVLHMV